MFSINKICPLSLIILDSCIVTIIVCINTNFNRSCRFLFIIFFREHKGDTIRAGTGYPSGAHEIHPGIGGVRVAESLF
jgi:hypothetical protein